jgi:hypothetical protein
VILNSESSDVICIQISIMENDRKVRLREKEKKKKN